MIDKLKPYAKAVVAVLIPVIGLAVTLGVIDSKTGAEYVAAVIAIATPLGVYAVSNAKPKHK